MECSKSYLNIAVLCKLNRSVIVRHPQHVVYQYSLQASTVPLWHILCTCRFQMIQSCSASLGLQILSSTALFQLIIQSKKWSFQVCACIYIYIHNLTILIHHLFITNHLSKDIPHSPKNLIRSVNPIMNYKFLSIQFHNSRNTQWIMK